MFGVPPERLRRAGVRAASEGLTLGGWLGRMIGVAPDRWRRREVLDEVRAQPTFEADVDLAEIVREGRGSL